MGFVTAQLKQIKVMETITVHCHLVTKKEGEMELRGIWHADEFTGEGKPVTINVEYCEWVEPFFGSGDGPSIISCPNCIYLVKESYETVLGYIKAIQSK